MKNAVRNFNSYTTLGFLVVFIALTLFASGCIGQDREVPPSTKDAAWLMGMLRSRGFTVADSGSVSQVFFSVQGRTVDLDGETIQVYEYPSPESAAEEASRISSDGSSATYEGGASMITWVSTPHFYKSERVIVIYVGDDPQVLSALEDVFGEQFAGGEAHVIPDECGLGPEITDVDIVTLESFPGQVLVGVKGEMCGCYTPSEATQSKSKDGDTFYILIPPKLTTPCPEEQTTFEELVKLDIHGLKAGVYTVDVHGWTKTFELKADGSVQATTAPPQTAAPTTTLPPSTPKPSLIDVTGLWIGKASSECMNGMGTGTFTANWSWTATLFQSGTKVTGSFNAQGQTFDVSGSFSGTKLFITSTRNDIPTSLSGTIDGTSWTGTYTATAPNTFACPYGQITQGTFVGRQS